MNYYVNFDIYQGVAYTDTGKILQIESFHDEFDEPCLPEDAVYFYVRSGHTTYDKVNMEEE